VYVGGECERERVKKNYVWMNANKCSKILSLKQRKVPFPRENSQIQDSVARFIVQSIRNRKMYVSYVTQFESFWDLLVNGNFIPSTFPCQRYPKEKK
jgi:hypothetical protein